VTQRKLHLEDAQARARGVDRHSHLAAEPGCNREARGPRSPRDRALPGERLAHFEPAQQLDQSTAHALRETEASANSFREYGDVQIAALLKEGFELAREIGVAQQQRPRWRRTLGSRQRLPFAATRQA
jgi:hypothetical protein